MHQFTITFPGTWIAHADRGQASKIQNLLALLERQFGDVVLALNLFQREQEREQEQLRAAIRAPQQQEDEASRLAAQLEERYLQELGEAVFYQNYWVIQQQIEAEVRGQMWRQGQLPQEYLNRLPFLYAHAFVYALDSFGRILAVIAAETPDAPPATADLERRLQREFPDVKGVRDSAHHIEDRGRGVDRHGKPLQLKPMDTHLVKAPGGALVLSCLTGDKLGYTAEDGKFAEVSINADRARVLAEIFQGVIAAFPWQGHRRLVLF